MEFCKKCTGREESFLRCRSRRRSSCCSVLWKMTEKTFACYHGAEYRFQKEWFDTLDSSEIDSVAFAVWRLKKRPERISFLIWRSIRSLPYFLLRVRESHCWIQSGWNGFFALHPILHLNQQEITSYTGKELKRQQRKSIGLRKIRDRYSGSRRLLLL